MYRTSRCSAAVLCRQQRANHDEAVALLAKYPHRFTVLRYEDLSVEPMDGAKALLARLGLPWVPEVSPIVHILLSLFELTSS